MEMTSKQLSTPKSGVSLARSNSELLGGVGVSAFYNMATDSIFSAQRLERGVFQAFLDQRRIEPATVAAISGDSVPRGLVIGYSNSFRLRKGELEQALWSNRMKTYDGCRASSVDLCDIIYGHSDFYVDTRALWSRKNEEGEEQEAMLQVYDVAAMLTVCVAVGLDVFTVDGKEWAEHKYNETLALVVCRKCVTERIKAALGEVMPKWMEADAKNGGAKVVTKAA